MRSFFFYVDKLNKYKVKKRTTDMSFFKQTNTRNVLQSMMEISYTSFKKNWRLLRNMQIIIMLFKQTKARLIFKKDY